MSTYVRIENLSNMSEIRLVQFFTLVLKSDFVIVDFNTLFLTLNSATYVLNYKNINVFHNYELNK